MSKPTRLSVIAILSACAASLLAIPRLGQAEPATKPATRPAEKFDPRLLKLIPDHCLGFVAVRSIEGTAGRAEALIRQAMGPMVPPDFKAVDYLKQSLRLGEGFDSNGSFALVMLHPKQYAPDLLKPPPEDDDPWGGVQPPELPMALIIPGKDAAKIFPNETFEKDGKYFRFGPGDDTPWALETEGFVIVGFSKKVIEAFPPAKAVTSRLLPAHKKMLARYNVFAWADRKTCSKLGNTRFAGFMSYLGEMGEMGGAVMPILMPIKYMRLTRGTVLKEATHVAVGIGADDSGFGFEVRWTYPSGSLVGKVLAAFPKQPGPLMTRLPDLPYIFAYGATKTLKTPDKLKAEQYAKLLGHKYVATVPEDVKAKAAKIILGLQDEVTAVQHYFGPNSKEGGPMGAISVIECKSPARLKKVIEQIPPVAQAIIRNFAAGDEDFGAEFEKVSLKHFKGLEAVGEVKVDAIVIDHPSMQEWDERQKNTITAIFGDDKPRFLIAEVDKKTLVITLGGGMKLMGEAIKGAKAKRNLEADAVVKAALARLPRRRSVVAAFNLGNAVNSYLAAMRAGGGPAEFFPALNLQCKEPLVGAVSVDGLDVSFGGYVPIAPLKEVFQVMMGGMGAPPQPGGF